MSSFLLSSCLSFFFPSNPPFFFFAHAFPLFLFSLSPVKNDLGPATSSLCWKRPRRGSERKKSPRRGGEYFFPLFFFFSFLLLLSHLLLSLPLFKNKTASRGNERPRRTSTATRRYLSARLTGRSSPRGSGCWRRPPPPTPPKRKRRRRLQLARGGGEGQKRPFKGFTRTF